MLHNIVLESDKLLPSMTSPKAGLFISGLPPLTLNQNK